MLLPLNLMVPFTFNGRDITTSRDRLFVLECEEARLINGNNNFLSRRYRFTNVSLNVNQPLSCVCRRMTMGRSPI
jgi:hypothetical protein